MADYIYLLENRLSPAQRSSIQTVRNLAKSKNLTVFLVGGAVRDLTSGSPVRDLDLAVQGEALKLRADLERAGAMVTGESRPGQALFLRFPGSVRMELGSTLSTTYPKPGKPVFKPATILDDLRRRDFTANAMALSLNPGSYGLLMDPLNGVADIENRQLRLASNYGFIEDPVRMIRAARLMARLGWTLEEKTQTRYQTGKDEGYISTLGEFARGYETEEIVHEEDPLRILKRLEAEGWMKILAPFWTSAKANTAELDRLREAQTQLQLQGIHPDPATTNFPLLTAKLSAAEVITLKKSFPRQGFVAEIDALEADTKELASQLAGKATALPSQTWKLLTSARAEIILSVAHSTKSAAIQAKFKSFYTDWPQARQKIPHLLLQELRIVPELPGYNDLLETLFFQLMDGNLSTPEEMKAFLEPYSPPAPPPPVNLRRARAAAKKTPKSKSRAKKSTGAESTDNDMAAADESSSKDLGPSSDIQSIVAPPAPLAPPSPSPATEAPSPAPVKPAAKKSTAPTQTKPESVPIAIAAKPTPGKPAPPVQAASEPPPPPIAAKKAPKKSAVVIVESAPVKAAKRAQTQLQQPVKSAATQKSKPAPVSATPARKVPSDPAAKALPVKVTPAKTTAKAASAKPWIKAMPSAKKITPKPLPATPARNTSTKVPVAKQVLTPAKRKR